MVAQPESSTHEVLAGLIERVTYYNAETQSHAYAPLAPVLHYNPGQGDLVGDGLFGDVGYASFVCTVATVPAEGRRRPGARDRAALGTHRPNEQPRG